MATNVQVFQDPDGGWGIRAVGDQETPERTFPSREEAERAGQELADRLGGKLVVHDESGETVRKESPGD
jgi:hypothetical protein